MITTSHTNTRYMGISKRILQIRHLIQQSADDCHRLPADIKLLAVSKGQSFPSIKLAHLAGINDFAESYLQEALIKMELLASLDLCWHFIGPIQGNKTKLIAQNFSWVHSVSRQKIAQQLNDARTETLDALQVCIQVNLDNEPTKSGIGPDHVAELAAYILQCPQLHLRGLMAIPQPQTDAKQQYLSFKRLSQLLERINHQLNINMDTLSMGMSNDFQAAISAGSTLVRIGSAIFKDAL